MPSLECVAVFHNQSALISNNGGASNSSDGTNGVITQEMRCSFGGWQLTGLAPYDSALERAIGTSGFLVFALLSMAYVACLVHVLRRPWLSGAKLLALYVGLATLYPFAFLSGIVLVRSADRHRVNITLLMAQAFVWYAFIRRYIAMTMRSKRAKEGSASTDVVETRRRHKRMARCLAITLLVGITAGQLVGGVVNYFSLLAIAALAVLLLAIDVFGSGDGVAKLASLSHHRQKQLRRRWRRADKLRLATWLLGVYTIVVTVFSPGFIGLFQVGGEAMLVFVEHVALVVVAFFYWHRLPSSGDGDVEANGNDFDDDDDDNENDNDDNASASAFALETGVLDNGSGNNAPSSAGSLLLETSPPAASSLGVTSNRRQ